MNNRLQNELIEISSAVCDDTATADQLQRLEQILADSPEAVDMYSSYMSLHSELFWHQSAAMGHVQPPEKFSRPSISGGQRFGWLMSLAAMLLVGGALGVAAAYYFAVENSAAQVALIGENVATVTGTRNCLWSIGQKENDSETPIGFGSQLYAGQRLELLQGLAEVTFNSGVRVIVEAPANFVLNSADESVLHQGRLTASVPPGAEGFQVACRGLTLVDRGTEFGVRSDDQGDTEVQVFDGLVDGYIENSEGTPFKKVSWKTNDVVMFDSATGEFRDVEKPSQFVRSLSDSPAINKGLFAVEDFDYSVGPLGGHNGGYGWGGPWENISFADEVHSSNAIGPGSIRLENVDNLGNHAVLSGQFNRIRRVLSTSFSGVFDTAQLIENQDGSRLIGRDGTTLYLSFVQQVTKKEDAFYGVELNRGDGNRNRVLCIGHGAVRGWVDGPPRSPDNSAGFTNWSVTSEFNGDHNRLLELGELGPETTDPILIVVKIVFGENNNDEVFVFVNPDPNNESHPLVFGKGNFAFDRIGIANFEGDKSFRVDHIRIGNSYSAVINPYRTPVSIEQIN